jgi:hypothetical protein
LRSSSAELGIRTQSTLVPLTVAVSRDRGGIPLFSLRGKISPRHYTPEARGQAQLCL